MKASAVGGAVVLILVAVLLAESAQLSAAVNCVATELAPCASAISSASAPSKQCCAKINEQKPCLCNYIRDPRLKSFVTSPNAKKVASTCGVPTPKC